MWWSCKVISGRNTFQQNPIIQNNAKTKTLKPRKQPAANPQTPAKRKTLDRIITSALIDAQLIFNRRLAFGYFHVNFFIRNDFDIPFHLENYFPAPLKINSLP
jgi:hypothetical protein